MATFAPSRAKRIAIARPMPDEAPVMSAFFPSSLSMRFPPLLSISTRKREVDVDLRNHFHRLVVQQRRLVAPLLYRFECGGRQQRVSAHHLQVPDRAVAPD